MKKGEQKVKENVLDILKRVAKRVEEATVDIHDMRFDLSSVTLRLSSVENNTEIMKIDMEKMKEEMVGMKEEMQDMKVDIQDTRGEMKGLEIRLSKRITYIADLITIELGGKIRKQEKRIQKLEHTQQLS